MAILTEMNDPRIRDVTVTYVEVTPDLREAKVHVSIMGDDKKQKLVLHGLRSAAGFLQSKVAQRVDTRYTPRLQFQLDQGVKKSIEITQILARVLPKPPAGELDQAADETDELIEDDTLADELDDDSDDLTDDQTHQP